MERHHLPIRQSHYQGRAPREAHALRDGRRCLDQQSSSSYDGRPQRRLGSQQGPPTRITQQTIPLEDSISNLYDTIDDAIQHFSHFEQEFRQDIHLIQTYCDPRLIEAIWMQKIRPYENKTRDHKRHAQHRTSTAEREDSTNRSNNPPPSIRHTMRHLLSSFDAALASAESLHHSSQSQRRKSSHYSAEDALKIHQQLLRSYQSLRKSLAVVGEKRVEMDTLNTELEMLRVFLGRNGAEEGSRGRRGQAGAGGDDGEYASVGGGGRHRGEGTEEESHHHDEERAWDAPAAEREEAQGWSAGEREEVEEGGGCGNEAEGNEAVQQSETQGGGGGGW